MKRDSKDLHPKIKEHGKEILDHKDFIGMKNYMQHGCVSLHDHCLRVAETSLRINEKLKKLRLHLNEREMVRGALLHDFFLYDWHDKEKRRKLHGFYHPGVALKNAEREFDLTKKEKNIIKQHMFPLTITKIPTNRESWVVNIADKWCSLIETVRMRKPS
ncbi:MAG: HD domain-containing protein [Lachnospiraceae bacterium]|nr:HD domain-containing protein [Lachnospiraceae bacterium]